MQHDQPVDGARYENLVPHPVYVMVEEAAHLRRLADRRETRDPVHAVLAFVPLVAIIILLVFGIARFS